MEAKELRRLSTFISHESIEFGEYILFQEYRQGKHDGKQYTYSVTRPILAIYIGLFMADQTIGFDYLKWVNEARYKETARVSVHVEWSDYLDILGHWKTKPNWKEIIKAYRCQNTKDLVKSDEIDWTNP